MSDKDLETYLTGQYEYKLAAEDDLHTDEEESPEYPNFLIESQGMSDNSLLKGEDGLAPNWLGAGEGGEEHDSFLPIQKKLSIQPEDENQEEDKEKAELCARFYEVLAERQEIRRKNAFLHKKMVEFYKKRKMDHLLKEDPKGLDMDNKYLKRLYELKTCISHIEEGKNMIGVKVEDITGKADELKNRVKREQYEFLEKQRKIASTAVSKNNKKISGKAISNFLDTQASNAEEIGRLRLKEIKMKKLLKQNQELLKELDSLGNGLSRADYEQLTYEYQNECRKLAERADETEKLSVKARAVTAKLNKAQHQATLLDKEIMEWSQRISGLQCQVREAKQRNYKLGKMRDNFKKIETNLKQNSGLLLMKPLLTDFEKSLAEAEIVKAKLEREKAAKERTNGGIGGQVNTPREAEEKSPRIGESLNYDSDDDHEK